MDMFIFRQTRDDLMKQRQYTGTPEMPEISGEKQIHGQECSGDGLHKKTHPVPSSSFTSPVPPFILDFQKYLHLRGRSENTIAAYTQSVSCYSSRYEPDAVSFLKTDENDLLAWKVFLIDNYRPGTVNIRLRGMNCYLESVGREDRKLSFVRMDHRPYLEHVITEAEYRYFVKRLKEDGNHVWYFVVRFLALTGARISELVRIKAEHVRAGHLDLYSKGGRYRRIYIPKTLQEEAAEWLAGKELTSGFIFLNRSGKRLSIRGISSHLKVLAVRYDVDPKIVYPHSFRHMFAKCFLERCNDISFLADLLGHESIETTRIYLRKTSTEQREIVDRVIDW